MKDWNRNTTEGRRFTFYKFRRRFICGSNTPENPPIRVIRHIDSNGKLGDQLPDYPKVYDDRVSHSVSSLRHPVTKKLILRENAYTMLQRNLRIKPIVYSYEREGFVYGPNGQLCLDFRDAGLVPSNTLWYIPLLEYLPEKSHYCTEESEAYQRTSRAFYSDLSEIDLSLLVTIKERQKTFDLLFSSARKLVTAFNYVKKGKLNKAVHTLVSDPKQRRPIKRRTTLSNQWLEFSYGWVPLYQDIYGVMKLTVEKPLAFPVKVSRRKPTISSSFGGDWTGQIITNDYCTAKANVTASEDSYYRHRLGLVNPALVVWELVPFSFVFDWFVPVGDWLEAQTSTVGLEFSNQSMTTRRISAYQVVGGPIHEYTSIREKGSILGRVKGVRRTLTLPAKPSLYVKNPLSVNHAITAVALFLGLRNK